MATDGSEQPPDGDSPPAADESPRDVSPVHPARTRQERRATEHRGTRTLLRVGRGLAALLAAVLVVGAGLAFAYYNRLGTQSGTGADVAGIDQNSADGVNREDVTILVVGIDNREGTDIPDEPGGGLHNTDTMMLIHVTADGKTASVVSFPRDSYVTIPGYGKTKLNAAYAYGYNEPPEGATEQQRRDAGQALLITTINQLTGVPIDHFVEVTLQGFKALTDAVGGIDVTLCQATKDAYSGADFPAGPQHLNGDQALSFVRQRHGLDEYGGDLARAKRQQYFIGALLRKVLDQGLLDLLNLDKLNGLIDALSQTITYDQGLNPLDLAEQMNAIAAGNVGLYTIPLADPYLADIDGMSVVLLAPDDVVKQFFADLSAGRKPSAPTTSAAPPPTTAAPPSGAQPITVDLYDGTTVPNALQTAADDLTAKGFTVDGRLVADSSDYDATEVQYPEGREGDADTVAAAIPGAKTKLVTSTPGDKIIVVIGANYPGLESDAGGSSAATTPADATQATTAAYEGCIN